MEKCAQSMLLLFNLPALFAPGNLNIIFTNTSFLTVKMFCPRTIIRNKTGIVLELISICKCFLTNLWMKINSGTGAATTALESSRCAGWVSSSLGLVRTFPTSTGQVSDIVRVWQQTQDGRTCNGRTHNHLHLPVKSASTTAYSSSRSWEPSFQDTAEMQKVYDWSVIGYVSFIVIMEFHLYIEKEEEKFLGQTCGQNWGWHK